MAFKEEVHESHLYTVNFQTLSEKASPEQIYKIFMDMLTKLYHQSHSNAASLEDDAVTAIAIQIIQTKTTEKSEY